MTGQQLIDRIVAWLRFYVVLTEGQALTLALWALNTWTCDKFNAVPYLEIWATTKRSGKSTLAQMLARISRGGTVLSTIRALQMVRFIEAKDGHYTPFVEEAERFNRGSLGDERSILATGYTKGAYHEITTAKGDLLRFRSFCAKAFVLIGNVHEILRDRCISIRMERGTPIGSWTMDRFAIADEEAERIVRGWNEVCRTHGMVDTIPMVDPAWLMSARDREIWLPLFSLARSLKLHKASWDLLVKASFDLSMLKTLPPVRYSAAQDEPVSADGNAAETVLRDAVSVIRANEKRIATEVLLQRLQALDSPIWRSWRGTGIDAGTLSALLGRYGLEPRQFRVGGRNTNPVRGYDAQALRDAAAK